MTTRSMAKDWKRATNQILGDGTTCSKTDPWKGGEGMKVELNPDKDIVETVREGLKRTGGYCPCRLERTEDTKCMCKEFKEQIADPNFEGFCHCMLYYKSLKD